MGVTMLKTRTQKVSTSSVKNANRHNAVKAPVVSVSPPTASPVEGGGDIFSGDFPRGLTIENEGTSSIQWYPPTMINSKRVQHVYGGTNLSEAARLGDIKQVKYLLDHSADPNGARSSEQATPLQCAAYHGHLDTMALLLNRGASVSLSHGSIGTALHAAALHGTPAACLLLISRGAHLEKTIARGRLTGLTPLQIAAFGHNTPTIKLLLDHGANCSDLSAHIAACGMFCEWEELSSDFQSLIIDDIIADASNLYVSIVEAAKWDASEAVHSFLSSTSSKTSPANLMTTKDSLLQRTPLHWAAATGSQATLNLLLSYCQRTSVIGQVLRMKDAMGYTPMMLACTYGQDLKVIKALRGQAAEAAKVASDKDEDGVEKELMGKVVLANKFLDFSF